MKFFSRKRHNRDEFETAVNTIRNWLKRNPGSGRVELVETASELRINPLVDNSFFVGIDRCDNREGPTTYTDHWHCHTDSGVQAASVAFWLLTPYVRVVSELKHGEPFASWIENYMTESWEPDDCVYYLNPLDEASWILAEGELFERRTVQQSVLQWVNPITAVRPGILLDKSGLPPQSFIGERVEYSAKSRAQPVTRTSDGFSFGPWPVDFSEPYDPQERLH